MKRVFSLIISFYLLINLSFGYVIEDKENIRVVEGLEEVPIVYVTIDFDNFGTGKYYDYSIPSDKEIVQKYVRSYEKGALTALQVCSNGGPNSGCDHILEFPQDVLYVQFKKSEIVEITPPTCLTDGSMKIKCKNMVKRGGFLGIGAKEEECGETADIILEKTGHNVNEELNDYLCKNCNEIHKKNTSILSKSDEDYHYYPCSFEGCKEEYKVKHDFLENTSTGKWICIVCQKENTRHKAKDEWSANSNIHFKKCAVEGCSEIFEEESHYGGTHSNEGECTRCKYNYQNHNNIDTSSFNSDKNGHYYVCSVAGCNASIKEPHEKSTVLEWNGDKHWYKCKNPDCDEKIEEEPHDDGDNNDGECIVCKRKYTGELERFSIIGIKNNICILEEIGDNRILQLEYIPTNLADEDFLWKSDDESIATVDQEGVVTAVSEGATTVRVFWKKKEAFCNVFVSTPPFEIKVDKDEIIEGEKTRIRIVSDSMTESVIDEISWIISNDKLARVQDNFLYTSKGVVKNEGEEIILGAVLPNGGIASTKVKIIHGRTSHDENGECSVCGKVIEDHRLSENFVGSNANKHWKVCSNEKCKGKAFSEQNHTGKSSCSLCDWFKGGNSQGSNNQGNNNQGNNNQGNNNQGNNNQGNNNQGNNNQGNNNQGNNNQGNNNQGNNNQGNNNQNQTKFRHKESVHWKVYVSNDTRAPGPNAKHSFINGECECGHREVNCPVCKVECEHGVKNYIKIENQNKHKIICGTCEESFGEEMCDSNGTNGTCSKCEALEKIDIDFDIPKKVYYIEEDQQVEINYTAVYGSSFDFEWTMSTMPGYVFKKGETSNDGTIKFWYGGGGANGCFYASLVDNDRIALSEEVDLTITLISGINETQQTITLIKNGPPKSACQVYFENKYVALQSGTSSATPLKLLIRTAYQDFDEKTVRELGESEFPIYEIKENSLRVESKDTGILTTGEPKISKVTDGSMNGYIAEIPVTVVQNQNNIGKTVQLEVNFTTSYNFNKHRVVEKERKYNAMISVVEKIEDIPATSPGSTPVDTTPSNTSSSTSTTSSALLAAGGVLGLLLLAFIGSKMFGGR